MSDAHSHAEIQKHKKTYILIFLALLVGTVLTVGMYYVHFSSMAVTVAIALLIASVKALLVAAFFMHLISEKKAIYSTLGVTFCFLAVMLFLIIWSRGATPRGTEYFATKEIPTPMKGSVTSPPTK